MRVQHNFAGDQAGHVQQVINDVNQVTVLPADDAQVAVGVKRAFVAARQDRDGPGNRRQRVTQLVPQHGQEMVFGLVFFLGGIACQTLGFQQALPLQLCRQPRLAFPFQQFARTDQGLIQRVNLEDRCECHLGRLPAPQRHRGRTGTLQRSNQSPSKCCGQNRRREHCENKTSRRNLHCAYHWRIN